MPLYEYECDSCGHRFELIRKFSDPPADTCPKCGGAVRKLQSAPAFQLKGTGWYATDYAKKDSSGSGKDQKPDAGDKDSKGAQADKSESADKTDKADKAEKPAAADKPASTATSTTSTSDTKS